MNEVVDFFLANISGFLGFFGINESVAKIWITILLSDEPLTQKDISDKTNFSLSLISPALKTLERLNLIEKIGSTGKNKKYKASKTLSEAFMMALVEYKNHQVQELEKKIKSVMKKKESNVSLKKEVERVTQETEELNKLISRLIKS